MGQYFLTVNLDKEEYLDPYRFGEGLKLMEFACSQNSILTALTVLLSNGSGTSGGDFHGESDLVGSWAGDRIVIIGEYAAENQYGFSGSLYDHAQENFTDISPRIIEVLAKGDLFLKDTFTKQGCLDEKGKWKNPFPSWKMLDID